MRHIILTTLGDQPLPSKRSKPTKAIMLRHLKAWLRRKMSLGDKLDQSQEGSSDADPSHYLFEEYHNAWHKATDNMYHGTTTSSTQSAISIPSFRVFRNGVPVTERFTPTESEAPTDSESPTRNGASSNSRALPDSDTSSMEDRYDESIGFWYKVVVLEDRPVYLPIRPGP